MTLFSIIFLILFATIQLIYWAFTLFLTAVWRKMPEFQFVTPTEKYFISIIVPVRNEESNILNLLADLKTQSYRHFELLVIDDASDDATASLVKKYAASSDFPICLLSSNRKEGQSPKKTALQLGIAHAKGTLILTTDGDCSVPKNWLRDLHSFYCQYQPKLISSGVTFYREQSGFEKMQTVEFMSLIGAGAVSMYLKSPNMCNGANLMYEKEAFQAVGGFAGSEQIASGDDEFLMHKIAKQYPEEVLFLKSQATTVKTKAQKTLKEFIQQRKRWASKWNHYNNWRAILTAIFIFSVHLSYLAGILGLFFLPEIRLELASLIMLKNITEFFYLRSILHFYGHGEKDKWIVATQIFHSLYIVLIGMAGKMGGYNWKGRKLA